MGEYVGGVKDRCRKAKVNITGGCKRGLVREEVSVLMNEVTTSVNARLAKTDRRHGVMVTVVSECMVGRVEWRQRNSIHEMKCPGER